MWRKLCFGNASENTHNCSVIPPSLASGISHSIRKLCSINASTTQTDMSKMTGGMQINQTYSHAKKKICFFLTLLFKQQYWFFCTVEIFSHTKQHWWLMEQSIIANSTHIILVFINTVNRWFYIGTCVTMTLLWSNIMWANLENYPPYFTAASQRFI